ncbi:MAG: DUF853 family protein [Deltaproteobacteria bacterium]|nr:DUF853 family protein [Deltaproteobacteria bacterium]
MAPATLTPGRLTLPEGTAVPWHLPAHHLVTHGVVLGMTGSGKTGLCVALVEEALRARVPVLLVDVKGDLPNLFLTFPTLGAEAFVPWVDPDACARADTTVEAEARRLAERWRAGLAGWGLGPGDVEDLRQRTHLRLLTPGTRAGEPVNLLSALDAPSALWDVDEEAARDALSATLSLVLRMLGHDGDASRSRPHVLLALCAERRLREGRGASLEALLEDLQRPPLARVGALALDDFLPTSEREALAQDLNTLIASPTFASWRQGAAMDVGQWLAPVGGRTSATIVSVAHLDDAERALVLSLVLEQVLGWVRGLPGTSELRALVLFDEVFGFLPPHPASPPTKRPLLALLKQARAFGVGLVLATQNPMDLDYKALSNAGLWLVGRLPTDADRERVVEGLSGASGLLGAVHPGDLADALKALPPRHFVVKDAHAPGLSVLDARWTLSWLRGPMTRQELRRLTGATPVNTAPTSPAPRALVPSAPSAAPLPPAGWSAAYASAPPGATLAPWVAATVVAHVRDAKLGVHITRTVRAMAPFLPDGRPDTARGRVHDPRAYQSEAPAGVHFEPLPDALLRRNATALVDKALRDELYRSLQVTVHTHRELGLVSSPDEPIEAFHGRVVTEARRRAQAALERASAEHAPKVQAAAERVSLARRALAEAERAAPTGGALATVAAVLKSPSRALHRLESQQDKIATKRERARAELARAETAHQQALASRDVALGAVQRDADEAPRAIEARVLGVKKSDVEVTERSLLWVPVG